jgi:hypothetical protein
MVYGRLLDAIACPCQSRRRLMTGGSTVGFMDKPNFKETAESVLRELPSVVGAFVREDAYGHPREIHLLIQPGPEPRHFARDVKDLLEERLGIPIDQRIISIAQLARDPAAEPAAETVRAGMRQAAPAPAAPRPRLRFLGSQTRVIAGRVIVRVELERGEQHFVGEAEDLETGGGRLRAGARAALHAATVACGGRLRLELDAASVVRASDRSYVLVSTTASAAYFGRRPLALAGAQELDEAAETAGALAALKATNRIVSLILGTSESDALPPRRVRRR